MRIKKHFMDVVYRFSVSFKRFPIPMFFAVVTVVLLMILNHTDYNQTELLENLRQMAMATAMGVPLSLIVKVFWERKGNRQLIYEALSYIGVVLLVVLAYFFLLDEMDMVQGTRYTAYMLALFLIFLLTPYSKQQEGFESYVVKLFTSFFITYLYSVILFGGLAAILGAIDVLFEVDLDNKLYFDMFLIVAGVVAPAVFLAEVPASQEDMKSFEYSNVLRVLMLYIVMPLIVAYTTILYAYLIRLLIIREWPRYMVSNLVVWYGIITAIVIFLIVPLRKDHGWARTFSQFMPFAVAVPFVIMFTAMGIRINAYGLTEPRYFVVLTALWLVVAMVHYVVFRKKVKHWLVVALLAAIAVLSVTGPWSAYSLSKWSQSGRFDRLLAQHQLLDESGQIQQNNLVPEDAKKAISSIINYYERFHDVEDLTGIPEDFTMQDMEQVFGFEPIYDYRVPLDGNEYFYVSSQQDNQAMAIDGYQYYAYVTGYFGRQFEDEEELDQGYSARLNQEQRELEIFWNDELLYSKPLTDMVTPIIESVGVMNPEPIARKDMIYHDESSDMKVMAVFRHINGYWNRNNDTPEIESLEMDLYFTVK